MCVGGGICISSPPPPSLPFILLLLDGATWPGKKHAEILIKTDLGRKKGNHHFQISP